MGVLDNLGFGRNGEASLKGGNCKIGTGERRVGEGESLVGVAVLLLVMLGREGDDGEIVLGATGVGGDLDVGAILGSV
jgi:hypothetical protein